MQNKFNALTSPNEMCHFMATIQLYVLILTTFHTFTVVVFLLVPYLLFALYARSTCDWNGTVLMAYATESHAAGRSLLHWRVEEWDSVN